MKKTIISGLASIAAISAATSAIAQPTKQYTLGWKIEELDADGWKIVSSGSAASAAPGKGKWSAPVGFEVTAQRPYLSGIGYRTLENGKIWKTPVESLAEYGPKLKVQFKSGKEELPVKVQFDDVKLTGKYDGFERFNLGDGTTIMLSPKNHVKLTGKDTVKVGEWAYPFARLEGSSKYRVAIKLTPTT